MLDFREENLEEVRRLNELIVAAKCNTILDNQVIPHVLNHHGSFVVCVEKTTFTSQFFVYI